MARITVEDCKEIVKDRFELVVLASRRARDIASGAKVLVERNADKDAVLALREIASKKVSVKNLHEEVISSYQRNLPPVIDEDKKSEEDQEDEKPASSSKASGMFAEDNIDVTD